MNRSLPALVAALSIAMSLAPCLAAPAGQAQAERAAKLHKEKKFPEALAAADEALQAGMKNFQIYILTGDCLMRLLDYQRAHQAFVAALAFDEKSVIALRGRATAALKAGLANSAIDATTRLIDLGEDEYLRRGKAFQMGKRNFAAIEDFQTTLIRSKPGSQAELEAYFERGEALQRLGALDLALADFDRAAALRELPAIHQLRGGVLSTMERSEEAVAAFTRSLKLNEHEDVLLLRGRELGYLDEFDKAIADFKRAAEVAPDDPETQENSKGNIAYMEGRKAGKPKPVRKTVGEPDTFRAEMDALEFDQPAAAKSLIDARLKKNPESVSALRALSRYHRHRGESEPAFEAIGKATKIDRDNPQTLREFAEAAEAIQRYGLATQGYSRAILKGDQGAQAARAEMFVGNSVAGAALDDLKAAIKLDPDNPRLHFLHSVSLLEQPGESSVEDSAAALEKAVALGYGGTRLHRGQVLEILGRHQQAITEFTIDIESDGVFAGIYLRRASCYRALGKLDLALADFKSAASSAKEGSDVKEVALRNIQSIEEALAADKK